MRLAAEHAKLREIFRVVLLASLAPACISNGAAPTPADAGEARDATSAEPDANGDDAIAPIDASDAEPDVADAYVDPCAPSAPHYAPDAGIQGHCYYYVDFPCGYVARQTFGCSLSADDCNAVCGTTNTVYECKYADNAGCSDGGLAAEAGAPSTVACGTCVGGRRPAGLARPRAGASTALGAHFARMAHLEAASVIAFDALAADLWALGAPRALVRAAERSARDEVRHARAMARLARAHGAAPPKVRVRRRSGAQTLARLARENAIEGCVRETFGALLVHAQAARADDPRLRAVLARIAADETRHAALAWAIDAWVRSRMDVRGRARLDAARARAVRALRHEASTALPCGAGLPSARLAARMVDDLDHRLWA